MRRTLKQLITESRTLKAVFVFLAAYAVLSVIWMRLNDSYGYAIVFSASKFAAEMKDARLEGITRGKDSVEASFSAVKKDKYVSVDVPITISTFAFAVPLVISALVSLYPFIKRRKRAYGEALLMVFFFHFLYVFFFEVFQLTNMYVSKGFEEAKLSRLSTYQFLWGVANYASKSFAPFLIVAYIFVRFRR